MHRPDWLVAYSKLPGRYYVVQLEPPVWFYTFDHVRTDDGCEFRAHSLLFLTKGTYVDQPTKPSPIVEADTVKPAFKVFFDVLDWFEPVPIYEEQEPDHMEEPWIFGTTPETCHDHRTLVGLRIYEAPFEHAVFSFDEENYLVDAKLSDDGLHFEVEQALEIWAASSNYGPDPTRHRFRL